MHLIRKIAWRMQANAEGGLSERARRRAEELANDADVRVTPPKDHRVATCGDSAVQTDVAPDNRLPFTLASQPTKVSTKSLARSMLSGNQAKPSSRVSSTRVGCACRNAMMTVASQAATWTARP
jgi:hypothetical protein